MPLVASPLWLLWLVVQGPATNPTATSEAAPAPTPEGPALPDGALPDGALPPNLPGVTGMDGMKSTDWVAPPSTSKRRKPSVGHARVESLHMDAQRIDDKAITIDGHLHEKEWKQIPLLPELVQFEPRFGFHPTQRTDVRIAYGQRGIYVAFTCYGEPKKVRPGVFRKDQMGPSDQVWLEIDPNNNDTNGFVFVTNPSGSQEDAQLYLDDSEEPLWDGVWQTAGKITTQGWTSEMFIPWSTIRFEHRDEYTFGVNVGRWINDTGELNVLSPTPQGLPGRISWALDYRGVKGIEPGLNLELRPFVSSRIAARRPDDTLDLSTPFLPNGGFDVKYGLRGNLTLDVAVNPDFGQAEVDPAVLNLGPFEVFFPERRQFFLESKEIFETRFQLFYSRRVGNNPRPSRADLTTRKDVNGDEQTGNLVQLDPLTRIFGALRLTGRAAKSWSVGALTATTGATYGTEQFTDGTKHRVTVDPTSQYSVLRVRKEFNSQTSVGAIATGVVRGGGEPSAFAGGFDYRIRFLDRWRHSAQVIGTHDGQKAGMGAGMDIRRSGKNLSLLGNVDMLTPHVNFNDLGFMRLNNYIDGNTTITVYNAQPIGRVRRIAGAIDTRVASSFQGDLLQKQMFGEFSLTTLNLWNFGTNLGGHLPQYDLYETRGGIPYEVPLHWWTGLDITSPDNRRVVGAFYGAYGEQNGRPGPDIALELRVRPINRLELTLRGDFNATFNRPRWTTTNAFGEPVFGRAKDISYTGVLRGTLGILPTLTLQSFNQLYYRSAHHDAFFILTAPNVLLPTDPTPYYGMVDQGLTSFISNSILRWEYLPGSFLFIVYTHRTAFTEGGGSGPVFFKPGSGFSNLVAYRAQDEDIVFVKLQHLFGL